VRVILKISFALLLVISALFSAYPAISGTPNTGPELRALLIACDDFVSQPDTTPSSFNNVIALRRALLRDKRGYQRIRVSVNQALDGEGFSALAAQAFDGASEGDVSLVYLSTHGIKSGEDGEGFTALMSDGARETYLSSSDLHAGLDPIPGKKILILDACFSGAAINKGMDEPRIFSLFTGPDFKVLTSAGGMEPSFLWTDGLGTVRGGSYFAQALVDGLSASGRFAADENQDGRVTLRELHAHQLRAYGASTPYAYPEMDDFPVFEYDASTASGQIRPVGGLMLTSSVIQRDDEQISFEYTLYEPVRLAYQLIYEQGGIWRFQAPQSIMEDGVLPPGRRHASLALQPGLDGLSGYLLLMVVTVNEDRADPQALLLLSVRTGEAELKLDLQGASCFDPFLGEEAAFILRHNGAVVISARILDEEGQTVARLMQETGSRPLHLKEEGTAIYWNGKTDSGQSAPPGLYRLEAAVQAGSQRAELKSLPILLKTPD